MYFVLHLLTTILYTVSPAHLALQEREGESEAGVWQSCLSDRNHYSSEVREDSILSLR